MPKRKIDIIDKLRKRYNLPEGMNQQELIAFLVALLFKLKKRRRARKQGKKPTVTGNVAGPSVSGRTIESDLKANKDAELKFYQVNRQPIPRDLLPAPQQPPALPAPQAPPALPPPIPPKPRKLSRAVVLTPDGRELPVHDFDLGKGRHAYATDEFKEVGEKITRDAAEKAARAERDTKEKILEQKLAAYEKADWRDVNGLARMTANAIVALPHNTKYRNKSALTPIIKEYAKKNFPGKPDKVQEIYNGSEYDGIIAELGQKGALGPMQEDYKGKKQDLLQDRELQLRKELGIEDKPIQKGGRELPAELNNVQIDQSMKRYPGYLGTIAHDQIKTLLPFVRGHHDMGFIINTDKSGKPGTHWQAVFISPDRDRAVEFYDSFGRDPDPKLIPDITALIKKLNLPYHLKFKVNKIDEQDANSENCGYFCIKFLVNRFRGESFKKATGFPHDEKQLDLWKKHFPPFKYIDV